MSRIAASCLALAALALVAGCAGTQAGQPQAGDIRFVPGDGQVEFFAPADRKPAPKIEGQTLDGSPAALAGGTVSVLNFWASWCAPCRAEAPVLKDIAAQTKAQGVAFLGIDFKDQKAAAQSFERTQQTGYPSLYDQAGTILLQFHGTVNPAAIPSTLIIDKQGRIAGRTLGRVKYTDLLNAITKVVHE
ncbi:TlpA family protein disulfide reductase [Streptosporangiaceae bacterium NEAU-GS5]|nr:TlpA family protein disulfide reductase [Streptosporangiaceae bacterium NEAU-GS5]